MPDNQTDVAQTHVTRTTDCELTVRRWFAGPIARVFAAWTQPDLLMAWWAPQSFGVKFVSCDADVRTGGTYRFVFTHPSSDTPRAFFGRYLDVEAPHRLVWTNEEDGADGAVTTVTFTQHEGGTQVVLQEHYASKQALDEDSALDSTSGYCEMFDQLQAILGELPAG